MELTELERFNNENFELFRRAVEENDISIVISEYCLPARIHFYLNSRNITVIFPLSASKMNLIERIIRSSAAVDKSVELGTRLSTHPASRSRGVPNSPGQPGTSPNWGFEKISFEGLFDLKSVQTFEKNKMFYYALFKKKNARPSFNCFSVNINCVYDNSTKHLKNKIRKLMPILLYKFQEHAVINTEMRLFDPDANYNFSKSYLNGRIGEVASEGSVGNFVTVDRELMALIERGMLVDCHTVLSVPMDERTTYEEFRDEMKDLRAAAKEVAELTRQHVALPIEFNSCEFVRGVRHLSYLANINLSKQGQLMRMCGAPLEEHIRAMGGRRHVGDQVPDRPVQEQGRGLPALRLQDAPPH